MKKLSIALFDAGLLMSAPVVMAHGGHDDVEPIDHMEASTKAQLVLEQLVKTQKLPALWAAAKAKDISPQKSHHGDAVWVVRYVNAEEKDAAKQNLYVILDEVGNTLAVNHDGKF